jgi:hypothetical protein
MCFNVTVSILALAGALAGAFFAGAAAFAIVIPLDANANRFQFEHYIDKVQKHAVLGPFSNEVGEKSSICCPKASAT